MVQNGLLPKQEREVKLFKRIMTLRQRPAQSTGDFLAHLATLERQLEHEIPDWLARMITMTSVHRTWKGPCSFETAWVKPGQT